MSLEREEGTFILWWNVAMYDLHARFLLQRRSWQNHHHLVWVEKSANKFCVYLKPWHSPSSLLQIRLIGGRIHYHSPKSFSVKAREISPCLPRHLQALWWSPIPSIVNHCRYCPAPCLSETQHQWPIATSNSMANVQVKGMKWREWTVHKCSCRLIGFG